MPKILFAGDFCGCQRTYDLLEKGEFSKLFNDVRKETHKADYSIVNLESPIKIDEENYTPISKCGPNIYSPKSSIEGLEYAGFNMCTLANNHIYDFGDRGVVDTINALQERGFDYVGAGSNIKEAEAIKYINIAGERFAFISCCEQEFSIADHNHAGAAPIDVCNMYYKIKEASDNANFVILLLHGGIEHYKYPSPLMKKHYRLYIDFGANIIINTHQHCINGFEHYNDGLIIYGLGNFCFDNGGIKNDNWATGLLCVVDTDIRPYGIKIIPIKQNTDISGITVLANEAREAIINEVHEINNVICDNNKIAQQYNQLLQQTGAEYSIVFNPFKNTILNKLFSMGIFPNVYTKFKLLFIQDMLTCDSHRDRLLNYVRYLIKRK